MLVDTNEQANKKLLESFKCDDGHYYTYLAKIKSHNTGLEYNLIQHSRAKAIIITFKGLHQYNNLSEMITKDCKVFMTMFYSAAKLSRLDIAIDSSRRPNLKTISANTKRKLSKYKNTTYFKTSNEKKTNQHLDIKHYHKKTIHITTHRIEFCFKKRYLKGNTDEIRERCQKIIQKALDCQIELDFSFLTNTSTHQSVKHRITSSRPIKLINKTIKKAIKYFKNMFGFKEISSTPSDNYKKTPKTKPNYHTRE
ncbi:MAG: hypothetical protein LBI78_04280 [Campylobacteraceae bacterium]|nr:hypothetical protein [Campylobacteraceae bacterium]